VVVVGIVVVLVVLLAWYSSHRQKKQLQEWEAVAARDETNRVEAIRRHKSIVEALKSIRSADDAFSYVLFEDFLYALYGEVHQARGSSLERFSQYVSKNARAELEKLGTTGVDAVVIGAVRVDKILTEGSNVRVQVVFTSNVSEREGAYYMEERWVLARDAGAKSRPPQKARVIGCANCGAPLDKMIGKKCGHCMATTKPRENDWYVESIDVLAREARGPMLTGTTEEVGTDWPTIVASDATMELNNLRMRDPQFAWPSFMARVGRVFEVFHRSWSSQDLTAVRPYLSDNLYELQRYWVDAYKSQGLRNVTENPTIVTVHLARITRDKFFDAIVVRVFATCVDYTVDASGKVVGGDRGKTREYSEYWTFIRGAGRTGSSRADAACPSCGGSIDQINMAGICGHCNAKVTTGEFDWVLSRIEQDEVYQVAA
jgi:hypothetical protein